MTLRKIAVRLALAALMPHAEVAASQSGDTPAKCAGERWLPPREIHTKEGFTIYMERPSIVPMPGAVFFIASPTVSFDSIGTSVWPLARGAVAKVADELPMGALVAPDGAATLIPLPNGVPSFPWMPEGVADDSGGANVVWGSDDNNPLPTRANSRSLWYARFSGKRWSAPTRLIATDGTVIWNSANVSPLLVHGGSIHFVVGVMGEGLRHFRLDSGVWTNRRVEVPRDYMGYPNLAILSSGRMVLIVLGGVFGPPPEYTSGFFATWSDNGGVTWSTPIPISTLADGPAYDARLLIDDRDILYAFWYQQTDSTGQPARGTSLGGSPGRIHAAQSMDRGVTWQRSAPTALIDNADELRVLLRPDRSVLAVVADRLGKRMLAATWSHGWSPFTTIEAEPDPFTPALGTDDAQRPFLSWGIRRSRSWRGTMLTTLVTCS
jgi:hypothetical protein